MEDNPSCCMPSREPSRPDHQVAGVAHAGKGVHLLPQATIPAGSFRMGDCTGDGNRGDGETPVHEVFVSKFEIDATSVTNAQFALFIAATGYRTEAETFGFSAVFHLAIDAPAEDIMRPAAGTPWWFGVRGADWSHPYGRNSSLEGLEDHPVVHVSWNDAVAYCSWADRWLPSEAQWERASRGGLDGARYPWGDVFRDTATAEWPCNIWQGTFPKKNTADDGWLTTARVTSFEPNGYGIWQTVGNVWEWCNDWFSTDYYRSTPGADPAGPFRGQARVLRGGSYLCHDSYCNRYRNSARSSNTPDSSTGNAGFRTVNTRASRAALNGT